MYAVLANARRREALKQLGGAGGVVTVHELSELVASRETGESPPPRAVRESVYTSLVQTHLPKLASLGVVKYDDDAQVIELSRRARDVGVYTEVVAPGGITWSELYRGLGIGSLTVLLAASLGAPIVASVDPLLWTSLFLTLFAGTSAYQLWVNRFSLLIHVRRLGLARRVTALACGRRR